MQENMGEKTELFVFHLMVQKVVEKKPIQVFHWINEKIKGTVQFSIKYSLEQQKLRQSTLYFLCHIYRKQSKMDTNYENRSPIIVLSGLLEFSKDSLLFYVCKQRLNVLFTFITYVHDLYLC